MPRVCSNFVHVARRDPSSAHFPRLVLCLRELSDRVAASQVVTQSHGRPTELVAGEIAVWISAVADYAERVAVAHADWVTGQPTKGKARASDCASCRKKRWRAAQKKREAARKAVAT